MDKSQIWALVVGALVVVGFLSHWLWSMTHLAKLDASASKLQLLAQVTINGILDVETRLRPQLIAALADGKVTDDELKALTEEAKAMAIAQLKIVAPGLLGVFGAAKLGDAVGAMVPAMIGNVAKTAGVVGVDANPTLPPG